ncbi:MAG: hypothetical protein ACOY93_19795 [Bacillota bacterium]
MTTLKAVATILFQLLFESDPRDAIRRHEATKLGYGPVALF